MSAEAQFARDFTEHYDELGSYFPEFLRLRELVKLATMNAIVCDIGRQLVSCRTKSSTELQLLINEEMKKNLDRKAEFKWPLASNQKEVDRLTEELLKDNDIKLQYGTRASWDAREQKYWNQAKRKIEKQLKKLDEEILSETKGYFAKETGRSIYDSELKTAVDRYLRYRDCSSLSAIIAKYLIDSEREKTDSVVSKLTSLFAGIEQKYVPSKKKKLMSPHLETNCRWVPKAFRRDANDAGTIRGVCGGVNLLGIAFNYTQLIKPSTAKFYDLTAAILKSHGNSPTCSILHSPKLDQKQLMNQRFFQSDIATVAISMAQERQRLQKKKDIPQTNIDNEMNAEYDPTSVWDWLRKQLRSDVRIQYFQEARIE